MTYTGRLTESSVDHVRHVPRMLVETGPVVD